MCQLSGPDRCWSTDQGLGKPLRRLGVHPMHQTTPLASGTITNHDEITVILIEPIDGTPALVRVEWPPRITTAAAARYPAVAAAIVRIIAESATELAGIKARRRL